MSRNSEKADSGLNRYYRQKVADAGALVIDPGARPRKVQSVGTIAEAEAWRKTLVGEISAGLSAINDPSLAPDALRELNDTLNRLHREKRAWEHHIAALGGNNHLHYGANVGLRVDGAVFYGRAKELPEAARAKAAPPRGADDHEPLSYYGGSGGGIDASRERVMEELNGALGERVMDAAVGPAPTKTWGEGDVERWMVERRKRVLRDQIMQMAKGSDG